MGYGCQGLDPGSKVKYLLNSIRCDKLSTVVTTVRVHPDKYEKDFDAVVTFLSQYINNIAPKLSVKVASAVQTRPAKQWMTNTSHSTFKEKIKLKKYCRDEYNSMFIAWHQQLFKLWKNAGHIKGNKTSESSRALKARVAMLHVKTYNSSN